MPKLRRHPTVPVTNAGVPRVVSTPQAARPADPTADRPAVSARKSVWVAYAADVLGVDMADSTKAQIVAACDEAGH